jgi:hypothetical protein
VVTCEYGQGQAFDVAPNGRRPGGGLCCHQHSLSRRCSYNSPTVETPVTQLYDAPNISTLAVNPPDKANDIRLSDDLPSAGATRADTRKRKQIHCKFPNGFIYKQTTDAQTQRPSE